MPRAQFYVSFPVVLLVALAAVSGPTVANEDPTVAALDALLAGCDDPTLPGGFAAAVVKDGAVVFSKGYGKANTEHGAPFRVMRP